MSVINVFNPRWNSKFTKKKKEIEFNVEWFQPLYSHSFLVVFFSICTIILSSFRSHALIFESLTCVAWYVSTKVALNVYHMKLNNALQPKKIQFLKEKSQFWWRKPVIRAWNKQPKFQNVFEIIRTKKKINVDKTKHYICPVNPLHVFNRG